jgi:hypothetical protein
LPHPRDVNSPELGPIVQRITIALKHHLIASKEAAE